MKLAKYVIKTTGKGTRYFAPSSLVDDVQLASHFHSEKLALKRIAECSTWQMMLDIEEITVDIDYRFK